jgi:hypothetical protein
MVDRDMSRLVRAVYAHRAEILERHPLVPLPLGPFQKSTPVAALILAWERAACMGGACPACGAPALGTLFSGHFFQGYVYGVCTKCARVVRRWIKGFGAGVSAVGKATEGTPYRFSYPRWHWRWYWSFVGIPTGLVTVLRKLGETDLPEARGWKEEVKRHRRRRRR